METILLAGGLGTRLHKVTGDLYPKSLAEVDGRPFIHYLVKYLESMGVSRFVFALSHHAQMIIDSVEQAFPELEMVYSIEKEPLGTGGAIKQALEKVQSEEILIVNSDSFMEFSLENFVRFSHANQSDLSIVTTHVDDLARFGAADIDKEGKLVGFREKGQLGAGYINSGVYLLNTNHPLMAELSGKFSFEHEVLSNINHPVYAMKNKGLFFDIGTPDDFAGAQALVAHHQHLFVTEK